MQEIQGLILRQTVMIIQALGLVCALVTNIPLLTPLNPISDSLPSPEHLLVHLLNPSEGYLHFHNSLLVLFCLPLPTIISQLQFPSLRSYLLSVLHRQSAWVKSKSKKLL